MFDYLTEKLIMLTDSGGGEIHAGRTLEEVIYISELNASCIYTLEWSVKPKIWFLLLNQMDKYQCNATS